MSAPDFYFAVNALFRYLHDTHGHAALVEYWRSLGKDYYASRTDRWKEGTKAIADDWREYFGREPGAAVEITCDGRRVQLDILVCPAIKHLRDHGREIVPYFCEHCDHVCGAMAARVGYTFDRQGGMGSCRQTFEARPTGGG